MKNAAVFAGIVACLLPTVAFAGAKHTAHVKKKTAATKYECQKCHMTYSAAEAQKDRFKDPMDGGKLVPVSAAAAKKSAAVKPMGGMKM